MPDDSLRPAVFQALEIKEIFQQAPALNEVAQRLDINPAEVKVVLRRGAPMSEEHIAEGRCPELSPGCEAKAKINFNLGRDNPKFPNSDRIASFQAYAVMAAAENPLTMEDDPKSVELPVLCRRQDNSVAVLLVKVSRAEQEKLLQTAKDWRRSHGEFNETSGPPTAPEVLVKDVDEIAAALRNEAERWNPPGCTQKDARMASVYRDVWSVGAEPGVATSIEKMVKGDRKKIKAESMVTFFCQHPNYKMDVRLAEYGHALAEAQDAQANGEPVKVFLYKDVRVVDDGKVAFARVFVINPERYQKDLEAVESIIGKIPRPEKPLTREEKLAAIARTETVDPSSEKYLNTLFDVDQGERVIIGSKPYEKRVDEKTRLLMVKGVDIPSAAMSIRVDGGKVIVSIVESDENAGVLVSQSQYNFRKNRRERPKVTSLEPNKPLEVEVDTATFFDILKSEAVSQRVGCRVRISGAGSSNTGMGIGEKVDFSVSLPEKTV